MWGLQLNVVISYLQDCHEQESRERRISTETYNARAESTVYVEELGDTFAKFVQEAPGEWVEMVVDEYSQTRGINEHRGIPISAERVGDLLEEMEERIEQDGGETEEVELLQIQLAHVQHAGEHRIQCADVMRKHAT